MSEQYQDTTRPLPQNLAAEQAAISILAKVEGEITAFPWHEKLFLNPACRTVFRAIEAARAIGVKTNKITLLARLTGSGEIGQIGGEPALFSLLDTYPLSETATTGHSQWFHEDLVSAHSRREIIRESAEMDHDLWTGQITAEEYAGRIASAADTTQTAKRETLKTQLDEVLDELEGKTKPECFGFGMPSLDRDLDGGIQRGELACIGGPTGGGKSLLLAQAALHVAASGRSVAFFSLEMPGKAILKRMISNRANRPFPTHAHRYTTADLQSIGSQIRDIARFPLTIYASTVKLSEIEIEARRLIKLKKADLVVVDYIQRVRHVLAKGANREQVISDISSRLKSLATTTDCAVLTASQLNKQGDVRESTAIEQDSDILLKITGDGLLCTKFRRGESNWLLPITLQGHLGRLAVEDRRHDDR